MAMKGNLLCWKIITANMHGLGVGVHTGACRDEPESSPGKALCFKETLEVA